MVNSKKPSKNGKTTKTTKKTSKKTSKKVSKPKKEKIFCGITQPIPKNHRIGSMKECLENKQVRYYGLKKIDSKIVDFYNRGTESLSDMRVRMAGLRGKLLKIKKTYEASKNLEEQKKLMDEFEIVKREIVSLDRNIKLKSK